MSRASRMRPVPWLTTWFIPAYLGLSVPTFNIFSSEFTISTGRFEVNFGSDAGQRPRNKNIMLHDCEFAPGNMPHAR